MTIEKARKILDIEALGKTDQEIENIISFASALTDVIFSKAVQIYNKEGKNGLENWSKN